MAFRYLMDAIKQMSISLFAFRYIRKYFLVLLGVGVILILVTALAFRNPNMRIRIRNSIERSMSVNKINKVNKVNKPDELKVTNDLDYNVDWASIKIRKKPASNLMWDKWIVITTINPPTSDVKKLATIKGWKVIVIGDTKSPIGWSYPNCVHLYVRDQIRMNYRSTDLIKFRSYARKNIGFLYAIQHGAKVIYETDDDNSPIASDIGFDPDSKMHYLIYEPRNKSPVMNPYAHFGQKTIWPRGYPLDLIGDTNTFIYRNCSGQNALVQQGVVNGDPDVDAIFRLTRKDTSKPLNVIFDSKSSPLLLPRGVMSPYNSQNTLHLYGALWGLVLPQTVAFRVCDIWRSYWAQRLLWELEGYLTFFPPNAFTIRNSHSYLDDFKDEKDLYYKSGSFVRFLIKWKPTKVHFFDKVIELSIEMAKEGFWGNEDVLLVKQWLIDLISIGYKPPTRLSTQPKCLSEVQQVRPIEHRSSYLGDK